MVLCFKLLFCFGGILRGAQVLLCTQGLLMTGSGDMGIEPGPDESKANNLSALFPTMPQIFKNLILGNVPSKEHKEKESSYSIFSRNMLSELGLHFLL